MRNERTQRTSVPRWLVWLVWLALCGACGTSASDRDAGGDDFARDAEVDRRDAATPALDGQVAPLDASSDASEPTGAGRSDASSEHDADATPPLPDASSATDANSEHDADAHDGASDDFVLPPAMLETLPYAREVVSLARGPNAGFGQAGYPEIVLGPPMGAGREAGSLDVLSLGVGGTIVLGFGDYALVDGPGIDLIVFENAFFPGGDSSQVFAEPAEVAVSEDGHTWHAFACDADTFLGCAGVSPVLGYDPLEVYPLDHEATGGDGFDLDDVGIERARYVRIRDLSETGAGNNAGFDLDAIGLVHFDLR